MEMLSRRSFTWKMLNTLLTFSLLETLYEGDLFGATVRPITDRWVAEIEQLSRELKDQKLPQLEWQRKIEELFGRVELTELLRLIDFDRLAKHIEYPDSGEAVKGIRFPRIAGLPAELTFTKQLFAVKKGRAIVPHGHHN